MAQMVKNLPAMWVRSLGQEDPLEKEMREELDTTEQLHFHISLSCIGEGNGSPLWCSCLENPRDGKPGGLPFTSNLFDSHFTPEKAWDTAFPMRASCCRRVSTGRPVCGGQHCPLASWSLLCLRRELVWGVGCRKNAGLFGHRWESQSHFEKLFFPPEAWSLLLK